jgi:hypothetical protein
VVSIISRRARARRCGVAAGRDVGVLGELDGGVWVVFGEREHVVEAAELLGRVDSVEHLGELDGQAVDLLVGQLEAGDAGDAQNLVATQHRARENRPPPGSSA